MIISASRRTDIPAFYSEWFFNRIKEGYVLVRNPMNPHQVSRVSLSPDVVDGIVFWTKNPAPMLKRLAELGSLGIPHACCVDKERFERIGKYRLALGKDPNQLTIFDL